MSTRKLSLSLALAACAALPGVAQNTQPGAESTNNTRSAPDVQVGSTPSSITPAGQPNTGGPLQQPSGQSPTGSAQPGTNGAPTGTTPLPGTGSDPVDRSTRAPETDTNKGASDVGTSTVKPDATATPDKSTTPATANPPGDATSSQPTPGTVPETKAPENGNETQPSPDSAKPQPTPHTQLLPQASPGEYDPLLQPPPLPEKTLSLVGGVARKVDPVRSRLILEPFGGGSPMRVYFDERTRFYRDGRETTMLTVHQGDRVYVDTMQLGANVFARNVRVMTNAGVAHASGQIVSVDGQRVVLNDRLSGETVSFVISPETQVTSAPGLTNARIVPGALAQVQFFPGAKGSEAKMIQVDAVPGASFTFQGRVTYVNVRDGVLAIENQKDGRNYELRFNPDQIAGRDGLTIGAEVLAKAAYNGHAFDVQNMQVVASGSPQ